MIPVGCILGNVLPLWYKSSAMFPVMCTHYYVVCNLSVLLNN